MVRQLSDYVQVYEDTLAPGQCQALIDRFEAAPTLQERTPAERAFRFVELNVSRHWPEVESHIFGVMMNYIQRYWEALAVGPCWPTKVDAERIRLKRYMPGGQDHFPPHVDVTNAEESRRFLTAILVPQRSGRWRNRISGTRPSGHARARADGDLSATVAFPPCRAAPPRSSEIYPAPVSVVSTGTCAAGSLILGCFSSSQPYMELA
jgi:hypothetical protein